MSQPQQRFPLTRPPKAPAPGVLNIRRDAQLVRAAAGDTPPTILPSLQKAQLALSTMNRAQIGDNVEELDARLLDAYVAIEIALEKIRTAFPELTVRHAA